MIITKSYFKFSTQIKLLNEKNPKKVSFRANHFMMLPKSIKELLFLSKNFLFRVIIVIFELLLSFFSRSVIFESKCHFWVKSIIFEANCHSRVQISISEPKLLFLRHHFHFRLKFLVVSQTATFDSYPRFSWILSLIF